MDRFTVVWHKDAEQQLIEIWLGAENREAVTAATVQIDRELSFAPETKGRILHEQLRALNVPPLRVLFSIQGAEQRVEVEVVRTI